MQTLPRSGLFALLAVAVLAGLVVMPPVLPAVAQSGGDYNLTWSTVDGGGASANGGDYVLYGTAGQPDAAMATGGDYALQGGFLNGSSVPTGVTLLSFSATPVATAVFLEWETASELDNLGFNLYRAEDAPDGELVRLNEALIPSQVPPGSNVGAAYTWLDESVMPATTYTYWLEEIDIYGQAARHGPVDVTLPPPGPRYSPEVYLPIISK